MDVTLSNLSKSYAGAVVFSGLSHTFPAGRTNAILGPSGCGKTTLLRILMGLERPDSGSLSGLEGMRFGAVFQEDRLCENLSPLLNLRLVCQKGRGELTEALHEVGLSGCMGQPVRELSGGMKRRVAIVRALLADFDVLFLDEPWRGLDPQTRRATARFVCERTRGKTVFLVGHDPSLLELPCEERLTLTKADI